MKHFIKIGLGVLIFFSTLSLSAQETKDNYVRVEALFNQTKDSKSKNKDSLIKVYEQLADQLEINSSSEDEIKLIINIADRLTMLGSNKIALNYLTKLNERKNLSEKNKGNLYGILGYTFKNLKAYALSTKYLNLSIDADSVKKHNIYKYGTIGTNYLALNQFDNASLYFKKQNAAALRDKDGAGIAGSLNNTGWSYLKEGLLDSAKIYFDKSIQSIFEYDLVNEADSFRLYNIYGNIGMYYQQKILWDSAFLYLKKDFDYNSLRNRPFEYMFSTIKELTLISFKLKQFSDAERFLNLYSQDDTSLSLSQKKQLIELKIRYNILTNTFNSNQHLIIEYINYNQLEIIELENGMLENNNVAANFLLDEAKLKSQLQEVELENKDFELTISNQNQSKLTSGILFIGFSFVLVLIILLMFRRQAKLKTEMLNNSLRLKHQDLTTLAISINQKHDQSKTLVEKLVEIKTLDESTIKSKLKELINELKGTNSIEKSHQGFYENFDTINAEFFDAIKKVHPNLTKKEKELCAFIRLGLNNKEISVLKTTTANSVKVSKYRLKSKLALNSEESLNDYIERF